MSSKRQNQRTSFLSFLSPRGNRIRQIDTIILVKDIKKSKSFYLDILGLEILHDWNSMVIFKNRLAIHQFDLLEPRDMIGANISAESIGSSNLIIYIETDSIDAEFSRLGSLGVQFVHGIVDLPWQKVFRLRDVDGYIVEVGEKKEI